MFSKFLKMGTLCVRTNGCDVDSKPLESNPYHAEISQNQSGEISQVAAKSIIKSAAVIDNPAN